MAKFQYYLARGNTLYPLRAYTGGEDTYYRVYYESRSGKRFWMPVIQQTASGYLFVKQKYRERVYERCQAAGEEEERFWKITENVVGVFA